MEKQAMTEQAMLYKKINKMRVDLSTEMSKSGENNYSHFSYFQLKDFMPRALTLCDKNNVFTKFQMETRTAPLIEETRTDYVNDENTGEMIAKTETTKNNIKEALMGVLYVTDLDTGYTEVFTKEAKEATVSGASAIQNVGATSTYMKRYMYMDLFEINENDIVDGTSGKPEEEKQAPAKQSRFTGAKQYTVKPKEELPKPPVKTATEVTEAPVTPIPEVVAEPVNTSELMKIETKLEIANYAKLKGLDQRTTIVEIAKKLNTDVPQLKENQKDIIKQMIDEMAG